MRQGTDRWGGRSGAWLLSLLLLLVPVGSAPATGLGPQEMAAMLQGMVTMMKLWSAFTGGTDFNLGGGSLSPYPAPAGSWAPDPWTGAAPLRGGPPAAGVPTAGRAPGPLEGRWIGESGDTLEFRGERFRLSAQGRGQLTGTFLVQQDRLALYVPKEGSTRVYRFERRRDHLALQDDGGGLLLFRAAR